MQMVIKVSIKDSINLLLAFETGLSHDETFWKKQKNSTGEKSVLKIVNCS